MSTEPIRSRGLVLTPRTAVEATQLGLRDRLRELPTGSRDAEPEDARPGVALPRPRPRDEPAPDIRPAEPRRRGADRRGPGWPSARGFRCDSA